MLEPCLLQPCFHVAGKSWLHGAMRKAEATSAHVRHLITIDNIIIGIPMLMIVIVTVIIIIIIIIEI